MRLPVRLQAIRDGAHHAVCSVYRYPALPCLQPPPARLRWDGSVYFRDGGKTGDRRMPVKTARAVRANLGWRKLKRRTRGPQSAAERELSRAKMQALNAVKWAGSPGVYLNETATCATHAAPIAVQFVHRTVMAELCAVSCVYPLEPKSGLPAGLTVEHLDHVKTHTCHGNLILPDKVIHDYISNAMWRNGCYLRVARMPRLQCTIGTARWTGALWWGQRRRPS